MLLRVILMELSWFVTVSNLIKRMKKKKTKKRKKNNKRGRTSLVRCISYKSNVTYYLRPLIY